MSIFFRKRGNTMLLFFLLFVLIVDVFRLQAAEEVVPKSAAEEYSFGCFPFLAPPTLEGIFSPMAAELSTALNRTIRYQSADSFDKFMDNLKAQQYDIAHIQPFDYVRIAGKAGYLPSAEEKGAYFLPVTDQEYDIVRHYVEMIGDK
ncbi:MAG: PhnD/SsuA/transferrin family substrate-binding protein [Desulfobulbaceae bacterium]|uniref:PhnD/SsuA/transferrin family substrate-binding protein n=1 Tax=Candidatus Desulfobia pelagia TaxID=2841692 RepID=A0A8J6NGJ1_9BACT|nr:PhnD/SsuA/transferrin family substrate-binding protein [Candidatus Desulfobia pelagia]